MRWLAGAAVLVAALSAGAFAFAGSGGGAGRGAYALVDPNAGAPRLIPAHTNGFTGVTSPAPGDYCLSGAAGVDLADTAAVASMEAFYSNAIGVASVRYQPTHPNCAADDLEVKTFDPATGPSDEIAFTVQVP